MPTPDLQILSFNLAYYRKQRQLSQQKLSAEAAVHRTYLAELEQGQRNPSIIKIYQLSIALKIQPYYLLKEITPTELKYSKENHFLPFNYILNEQQLQTKEEYMKNLIKTIKGLRNHFNYNQKDLATLANLSESFIRTIEQGRQEPTLASLTKIAEAFQLPLWKLVKGLDWNAIWLCHDMWV